MGVQAATSGGGVRHMSGTSMASPHVAGAFAALQSATGHDFAVDQVGGALARTGAPVLD